MFLECGADELGGSAPIELLEQKRLLRSEFKVFAVAWIFDDVSPVIVKWAHDQIVAPRRQVRRRRRLQRREISNSLCHRSSNQNDNGGQTIGAFSSRSTKSVPAVAGTVAVAGRLCRIASRKLARREMALWRRDTFLQLTDLETSSARFLQFFGLVHWVSLLWLDQFWPGGAWPAGFVCGIPLALPLGVFPPPFTCVIDGAIRASSWSMRNCLRLTSFRFSAGRFMVGSSLGSEPVKWRVRPLLRSDDTSVASGEAGKRRDNLAARCSGCKTIWLKRSIAPAAPRLRCRPHERSGRQEPATHWHVYDNATQ